MRHVDLAASAQAPKFQEHVPGLSAGQHLASIPSHFCLMRQRATNLRPRGKGRKLAWQRALHENTMMLRMQMVPNVMPVATCRRCPRGGWSHGQSACKPAGGGKYL